jgi:hypothetical protein
MPGDSQDAGRRDGQVLVQLELHRDCGIGSSSSRASAAPYAAAARTATGGEQPHLVLLAPGHVLTQVQLAGLAGQAAVAGQEPG